MKSSFKKNLPLIIILIIASIVRLYQVTSIPVSLSWDEAAIGWNAKSIFHTRRDEYGKLLPLVFKSFGDYKAPLYIYLTAPIVGIFGLSTFNIRILSIISGVVSVISIYLLVKNQTKNKNKALISSLLFAITPWSIIFSRGAFEQNLSVALILLGTYLFFTAFKKPKILFLSTISFTLSLYAYHSAKIFTPLLTLYLIFLYKEELFSKKNKKFTITSTLLAVLLLIPLLYSTIFSGASARLKSTSIFSQEKTNITATLTSNYLNHFSPKFIFLGSQNNYRQQLKKIGPLLLIEAPFLIYGLFILIKGRQKKFNKLIIFWLLIGPIAATITKEAPHQIRSFNMLPALIITIAVGINKTINSNRFLKIITFLLFFTNFIYFSNHYLSEYKIYSAKDWQYGYQQVAKISQEQESLVDQIVITSKYGQPHIFTLVYQDRNPLQVFWGAMSLYLYREINWYEDQMAKNKIYFATPEEIPSNDPRVIDIINFPDKTPAFIVAKT